MIFPEGMARMGDADVDTTVAQELLEARRADYLEWGLDPDRAGGYAVITNLLGDPPAPFELGEIVALNGEFERELNDDRKPSKWDGVTCEWFGTDYDAAVRRSSEVTR